MIHSTTFSFDESSEWDPKVIRRHLCIPEEQLNILNNIPEWAKAAQHSDTFRIGKDTTENSFQFHVSLTTQKSQTNKDSVELFENFLQLQGNVLNTYQEYRKKFTKGTSLCEFDTIGENLSHNTSLKRNLSLPNLCQSIDGNYIKALHQNSDTETTSPKRFLSQVREELPIHKPIECSGILNQKDTSLSKSTSLSRACSEIMEVVSQLPVNISDHVKNTANNELRMDVMSATHPVENSVKFTENISDGVENVSSNQSRVEVVERMDTVSPAPITETSIKLTENISNGIENISSNEARVEVVELDTVSPALITGTSIKLTENISNGIENISNNEARVEVVEKIKISVVQTVDNLDNHPVNVSTDIEKPTLVKNINVVTVNHTNLDIEKSLHNVNNQPTAHEPDDIVLASNHVSAACEKVLKGSLLSEDSCIITGVVSKDVSLGITAEKVEMNFQSKKLTEINEKTMENLETIKPAKEQSSSVEYLILNNQGNSDLQYAGTKVLNYKKTSHEEISTIPNKSVEDKVVAEKRKSDFKLKSSKKRKGNREKPDNVEVRSIKKAGEVHYTVEDIETMIDIIKHYL